MTAARHRWKSLVGHWPIRLALAFLVGAFGTALAAPAPTTSRIVVDWHTGLAIYGVDPVGYFTDARPVVGRPEIEYAFSGGVWRFRNLGNRAAFAADPEVYMPRFGGYDPLAIAHGITRPGHPDFWLIVNNRLYLFDRPQARASFAADPEKAIAKAEEKWPQILARLVP
jgi:hypothetical protein